MRHSVCPETITPRSLALAGRVGISTRSVDDMLSNTPRSVNRPRRWGIASVLDILKPRLPCSCVLNLMKLYLRHWSKRGNEWLPDECTLLVVWAPYPAWKALGMIMN